jgi:hypothetical protein
MHHSLLSRLDFLSAIASLHATKFTCAAKTCTGLSNIIVHKYRNGYVRKTLAVHISINNCSLQYIVYVYCNNVN